MKAIIKEDTKVLLPNRKHQSFSEGAEVLTKGSEVNGEPKQITGLRLGKPFTYHLFLIDGKKLVFLNKVDMDKTEITMNATGTAGAPDINLKPAEYFTKLKLVGLFGGAAAGFAFCKYKKRSDTIKCVIIGAIIGYVGAFVVDTNRRPTVTISE